METTEPLQPVDDNVLDDTAGDDAVPPVAYDITSYGADYDVEGLVRKMKRGDIFVPPFQRSYVWKLPEASRFIESLLLGLPVPGIFLALESETGKHLVIDGQQRLKTLQFFSDRVFNPQPAEKRNRVFALSGVQTHYEGKTYAALDERDRLRLDNSIIHAIIVRQQSPPDDDTSIYHIFKRLNSAGRPLTEQEMRCAIYHGEFIDLIKSLNEFPPWRELFGPLNPRLKDQELILRFLALYFDSERYSRPMAEFLTRFTSRHRKPTRDFLQTCRGLFVSTVELFNDALGTASFRPERTLNAAVFDAAMVGLAHRAERGGAFTAASVETAYDALLLDTDFQGATQRATADEASVKLRLTKATAAFSTI